MNTWVVGNAPVVHHQLHYPQPKLDDGSLAPKPFQSAASSPPDSDPTLPPPKTPKATKPIATLVGEKTFLLKARIMAGRVDINANKLDLEDYKWLCKEELQKQVDPQYWRDVRHALVER